MNKAKRPLLFVTITPIFIILSLWVSVLPHEYAHSTTAWLFGYKLNPFDIDYGSFDWKNILFVDGIDENINYFLIYLFGDKFALGMIAFAGPFIATLSLYLISLFVIRSIWARRRSYFFYFCVWLNASNLSELISYVVLRSITKHGDIGHIEFAWGVSQWLIFTFGSLLLALAAWHFFSRTLIDVYLIGAPTSVPIKCFFSIVFAAYLLAYPAARVFLASHDVFSRGLSTLLCLLTPIVVIACWPKRDWVKEHERAYLAYSGEEAVKLSPAD